jgi:GR25 family glycosyltransferase involved in LPS biosynthesis
MKIDHIYVINLKRDVDRKKRMEEQLKKHDLQKYTFFEAIDGQNEDLSKYDFKVIPEWYNPINKKIMTKGEIACALSHYKLWEQIIVSDFQNVLILEDDAIFLDHFSKKIEEMDMTNVDIDFLYLGRRKLNVEIEEEKFNDFLLKPLYSYRTHAYILQKNGAKKLLSCNYLNHLLPVDEFLSLLYDKTCYSFIYYSK